MTKHSFWGIDPSGYCNCGDCEAPEPAHDCEDCGYPEDSFACKIRHQGEPIIKWGRASQQ